MNWFLIQSIYSSLTSTPACITQTTPVDEAQTGAGILEQQKFAEKMSFRKKRHISFSHIRYELGAFHAGTPQQRTWIWSPQSTARTESAARHLRESLW